MARDLESEGQTAPEVVAPHPTSLPRKVVTPPPTGGGGGGGGGGRSSGGGGGGNTSSSRGSGGTPNYGTPTVSSGGAATADAASVAASFGYSLAFFNSNPELKDLLDRAVSQGYNPQRFVAELQNTGWFRNASESVRKYQVLQSSDPATLTQMTNTAAAHILNVGGQLGADISGTEANFLADLSIKMGWNEDQIKQALADRLSNDNGTFRGQAGAYQRQYQELIKNYGVNVSDDTVGAWVKQSVLGQTNQDNVKKNLTEQAASRYVAFADRLRGGEDMRQISDPYVQSMSKLLELNPSSVGIMDNSIQQALMAKDKDGQPTAKTLWQFENDTRQDPRWTKTKNAQDAMLGTANKVLGEFGLVK